MQKTTCTDRLFDAGETQSSNVKNKKSRFNKMSIYTVRKQHGRGLSVALAPCLAFPVVPSVRVKERIVQIVARHRRHDLARAAVRGGACKHDQTNTQTNNSDVGVSSEANTNANPFAKQIKTYHRNCVKSPNECEANKTMCCHVSG